ncbi:HAD family hydrolase [Cellulomonas marina]|uniref:HAD-superfamily subfamily IB hydrolase, TIGR01490 n=1 Tax=Cellulomonas marina TaxID=988821 RepID=A0A1I0XIC9_9CELL|nr:HAD family hydrolase [Cellulomonas marina]GIG29843.1 hypothetical protein Cma02nite_24430 [Cellulomonas marina]SFB00050.1 HAD-superfamily subfamily IB hydrolase, TIGR01490 [Cellulomonas marina]
MDDARARGTASPTSTSPTSTSPTSTSRTGTVPATATPSPPSSAAAFFDLDKTLIATTTPAAFSAALRRTGLLTRRAMLRAARAQTAFLLRGATADRTERLKQAMTPLVRGWDVDVLTRAVADAAEESVRPLLSPEAVALVEEHHAQGRAVVVVSASPEEMVRPIAALIGADAVVASRMHVVDGRYTGAVEWYCYGERKAEAMRALAAEHGWDLAASYAYSDSVTDAPMLAAVGHAFVVNPDRALVGRARAEGWGQLVFRHPRPFVLIPGARTAGVAAALAAVAAAVAAARALALVRRGARAAVVAAVGPT